MTTVLITAGIGVGLLFAGLLGGYVIAEQTYSPRNLMMNNPQMQQQMMDMMMNDQGMMNMMGNNMMMGSEMMDSMMSNMQFSTTAPMMMPMIDGYYNGDKVFFVHTEVSDNDMAQMMSTMINFPTLHSSDLTNISHNELSKVYVFTNGIPGSEPYGGGPFMFQIDVFDSIPDQMGYSQYRVPHLVTWNDDSTPRILTSESEILESESNGEVTIQKTDNVVNAPMIVWKSNGMEQKASIIQNMFESMPGVDGEVTNIDVGNYLVMMKLHSKNDMSMMGMSSFSLDDNSKPIHMGMNMFMPNKLHIEPNTTIYWQTHDMEIHNVSGIFVTDSGNKIPILSGDIAHMETWSYTFEESGVFEYTCGYHENEGMKGEIVVTNV